MRGSGPLLLRRDRLLSLRPASRGYFSTSGRLVLTIYRRRVFGRHRVLRAGVADSPGHIARISSSLGGSLPVLSRSIQRTLVRRNGRPDRNIADIAGDGASEDVTREAANDIESISPHWRQPGSLQGRYNPGSGYRPVNTGSHPSRSLREGLRP